MMALGNSADLPNAASGLFGDGRAGSPQARWGVPGGVNVRLHIHRTCFGFEFRFRGFAMHATLHTTIHRPTAPVSGDV